MFVTVPFCAGKYKRFSTAFQTFFYQGLLVVTIALILTYALITLYFMFYFELFIFIITNFLFAETE